jgi:L-ascorbate metabolism protein UlaG (beta-lactamase superfamily)/rhodanese-related sulfurtransferase
LNENNYLCKLKQQYMKKIIACLLATFGITTACCQQNYENTDPEGFAVLTTKPNVVLLDVRTIEEFEEGHIEGALNIDVKKSDFMEKVKQILAKDRTIAVYCRSGRRSASAAADLGAEGYKVVNLLGGIMAWKETGRPVTTDSYEVDVFQTKSGKTVKFHALVHASIRMEYDGREIVIDPVTKLGNKTIDYASMPKADYLLVTHEHFDHFNKEAIKLLSTDKTRFITNQRCAEMYGSGEVMKNGDKMQMADDFTIEAVPAYNNTEGHLQFHPKGRDNGYVLTVDGLRIYVAGDTEDIPEMADIKEVDIAFLPCNQPYTMTTDQLVKAAKIIKPKVLFPYHYGQTDVSGVPAQLRGEGIDVRIRHYE